MNTPSLPKVRFGSGLYDRMLALYTGEVKPAGIDFEFIVEDSPRVIFDSMARGERFDAAEMSSSEYISMVSAGDTRFVAIPVFPSRVFRHGFITVNNARGVRVPRDLAGKRIGVPLYTMTAAVWIRGHLEREYGVDLSGVTWVQGSINDPSAHGNPAALAPVRAPRIEINRTGKPLSELIDTGAIDAIIGTDVPESIRHNPAVVRLFPNYREVEREYFVRTGIFPIMHLVVIRREIHAAHPEVAPALYHAFEAAKQVALKKMHYLGTLRYMVPWLMSELEEIDTLFGGDPWPYGLEANRATLQTLVEHLVEQGIIAQAPSLERLFVPVESHAAR